MIKITETELHKITTRLLIHKYIIVNGNINKSQFFYDIQTDLHVDRCWIFHKILSTNLFDLILLFFFFFFFFFFFLLNNLETKAVCGGQRVYRHRLKYSLPSLVMNYNQFAIDDIKIERCHTCNQWESLLWKCILLSHFWDSSFCVEIFYKNRMKCFIKETETLYNNIRPNQRPN